ncbi:MAG: type III secretion protein [Actinobacteria bacterium]|nr:type III secretion protein [Actinomycetota bacterium]
MRLNRPTHQVVDLPKCRTGCTEQHHWQTFGLRATIVLSIPQILIESVVLPGLLASIRVVGMFLSIPFFALQTIPARYRIAIAMVISFGIPIESAMLASVRLEVSPYRFFELAGLEAMIGLAMGWFVRLGMIVFDLAAEIFSLQTGLSFASQYNPDQALPSGVVGSLFGIIGLALMFALNLHLVAIEILFDSFRSLPVGVWPSGLKLETLVHVVGHCFGVGLILALPFVSINLVVMAAQGFMGRTSPQMNLFSIGFALTIPVGVFLLYVLLPAFPEALLRSQEAVYGVLRASLGLSRGP